MLWNFPGGTEENINNLSVVQDLNLGTPEYETLIGIIRVKYSVIIMMINRGNQFLNNETCRPAWTICLSQPALVEQRKIQSITLLA